MIDPTRHTHGLRKRVRALTRRLRGVGHGSAPTPASRGAARPAAGGMREPLRVRPRESVVRDDRINLVVSSLAAGSSYGGVQTATDLFQAMAGRDVRRRIISVEPLGDAAVAAFPDFRVVDATDDPDAPSQLLSIATAGGGTIPVGPRDVFIATFWPTAAFVLDVRRWQEATFGAAPERFVYLVQDYEPGFYPRSAQQVMARATYDAPASTIAVFNTTLLQGDFHRAGIRFSTEFAFEPRLPPALRAALAQPARPRTRQIVVYGRPSKPRNAFGLIVDGLRAWCSSDAEAGQWSIVSAGEHHADIDLGGGAVLRSLGKLSMEAYADLLRTSAIGVSLMISPHPSYPPLEMAQLGMLVLTNRYGDKDLSAWHTNISSLGAITEDGVSEGLSGLCRRFTADPAIGDRGRLLRPDYVDDGPQFPFAGEVVDALLRRA
jgi:hypothetical protein